MRIPYRALRREGRLRLWPVALLLTLALATQGCSSVTSVTSYAKSLWSSGDDTDLDEAANANEGEPLPPPSPTSRSATGVPAMRSHAPP